MASPAGIHAACWASEKRLFHTCSLLAANTVPPAWKDEIVASLSSLGKRDELCNFDGCLLASLLSRFWSAFPTTCLKGDALLRWQEWSHTLDATRPDVNSVFFGLFVDSSSDPSTKLYKGRTALDLWVSWRGLHILQLAMQELLIPLLDVDSFDTTDPELLSPLPKLLGRNEPCHAVFWDQLIATLSRLASHAKTPPLVALGTFISRSASRPVICGFTKADFA
jgi:hypothetical protein